MILQNFFLQVREEKDKLFLLFAMLCGFLINVEYAITKPTSNSIFLAYYSVKLYPYAWLLTVPLNLAIVTLYNRFLPRIGCFPMFLCTTFAVIGINLLCSAYVPTFPALSFFLYIWKDIYVLVMLQQVWSVIHSKIEFSKAKYLYGIIFGVSGMGAIFGSMIPGFFAVKWGSEHLLQSTLPIYLLFIAAYFQMLKRSQIRGGESLQIKGTKGGFQLIKSSSTLKFILLIVIFMQLATTIMDYQFNSYLQEVFPLKDLRTEFYGRLWGVTNACKLCLQFFATFLLIKFLGLRKSHFVVPGVLLGNAILTLIRPTFHVITYGFSVMKIFDYSIFNIVKEMLYVPLKRDEKFKAKAIIDVFAYRSAKGLASLFVLGVQFVFPSPLPSAYCWGPLLIFSIWIAAVYFFLPKPEEEKLLEA